VPPGGVAYSVVHKAPGLMYDAPSASQPSAISKNNELTTETRYRKVLAFSIELVEYLRGFSLNQLRLLRAQIFPPYPGSGLAAGLA
jgi:hypothetical protein